MNTINFKKIFFYALLISAQGMYLHAMIEKLPILPEDIDKMEPAADLWTKDSTKTAFCCDAGAKKYTIEILDLITLQKIVIPFNYQGKERVTLNNRNLTLSPNGSKVAHIVSYCSPDLSVEVDNQLVITSLDTDSFRQVKIMLPKLDNNQIDDYRVAFDASTPDALYVFEANKKCAYTIDLATQSTADNCLQAMIYEDFQTKKLYGFAAYLLDFSAFCRNLTQRLNDPQPPAQQNNPEQHNSPDQPDVQNGYTHTIGKALMIGLPVLGIASFGLYVAYQVYKKIKAARSLKQRNNKKKNESVSRSIA